AAGAVLSHLDREQAEALIAGGAITGGMIPKVRACLEALRGARLAAILDGRAPGALSGLLENAVAGTVVTAAAPATAQPAVEPDIREREAHAYMHTFKREPLTLVRGQGSRVWDDAGRGYLDLVAGIAVNVLG